MAGRIQFRDRKPESRAWPSRLLAWLLELYRSLKVRLWGEKQTPTAEAAQKPSRVRFRNHQPPPLVIREAPVHCPACGLELLSQSETVACSLNSAHVVHARCGEELLRGKCPLDGAALIAG